MKRIIVLTVFSLFFIFSQTISAQNGTQKAGLTTDFHPSIERFTEPDADVSEVFPAIADAKSVDFDSAHKPEPPPIELKKFSFAPESAADKFSAAVKDEADTEPGKGFNYGGAIKQSLLFLSVQHGYAILGQAKTRRALKHGPFFKDYVDSVKSLHGWDDGGRFFTNYIAHPMQGALTGHIYVQNSPQALREKFSMSPQYWKTRMKAFLWTAAWSTQFEIGPISQASIGNVGLKGKQTYEDIVVTPIAGTIMLVAEDAIDRYVIERIERGNNNFYVKVFARMIFNPTRNFSNMLRFKEPWHRDR